MPRTDITSSGSILGSMYGALTRVVGGLWSRYGGWGWSRIRSFLPSARFDWEREAGDFWQNSIVALGIGWLGDRFPRPILQVSKIARNGDHQPLGRSAVVDLWNRPNRYYSRRTLEKAVGLSLKCDGNAYIYKVRDNLGRVSELWWVPHYRILPTWPADGSAYIDGYRTWLDNAVYVLPPEDIIHIRDGIDPRNERLGLSALRANVRECVTVNMESGYTAALLKNSGVPSVVIVPDGDGGPRPDQNAIERMKGGFLDATSGDMAGGPIVMAGKYRVELLGFSPEQLRLDMLPTNAIARIASAIGVAAMSLGLPDPNKTYSNLAEANRASWGTVVSIQELIGEAIRWELLPEPIVSDSGLTSPGLDPYQFDVDYDYSHIQELQESLDAVHKRTRDDWVADMIRRNEAREQLGYDPDPMNGDVYYSEMKAALKPEPLPPGGPAGPGEPGPEDAVAKGWELGRYAGVNGFHLEHEP